MSELVKRPQEPGERVQGVIYLAVLVAGLAGILFTSLLPTALGQAIALVVAAAAAVHMGWASRDGGRLQIRTLEGLAPADRQRLGARQGCMRVPLTIALTFFVTYGAVTGGAMWLVTVIVGRPASRTLTIAGIQKAGRGICRQFEVSEQWFVVGQALCASDAPADQAIAGRTLTVYGNATAVGMVVQSYRLGPVPKGLG